MTEALASNHLFRVRDDISYGYSQCLGHAKHFFPAAGSREVYAFEKLVLAILKLRDISSFTNTFVTYDLLARKDVRYGYFYPFGEAIAGMLMIAGALIWLAAPLALFIGSVGAVSVIKAVYVEKRDLKCACVGGDSNVPLGVISLTENVMMVAMGVWMLVK